MGSGYSQTLSRLTHVSKEIATFIITVVSEEIHSIPHSNSEWKEQQWRQEEGTVLLRNVSGIKYYNKTFSLVQPHTHTCMYNKGKKELAFILIKCAKHWGPHAYVCVQFQDRTPTENKVFTEWMSEMFMLCKIVVSYQEFKNEERQKDYL